MSYWLGLAGVLLIAYVMIVWEEKVNAREQRGEW
jgi:hypothetical protein